MALWANPCRHSSLPIREARTLPAISRRRRPEMAGVPNEGWPVMIASQILQLLCNVHARGSDRWIATCPAHEDRTPSLAITHKPDKVLIKCWAGCHIVDIVEAIGIKL